MNSAIHSLRGTLYIPHGSTPLNNNALDRHVKCLKFVHLQTCKDHIIQVQTF